MLKATKRTIFEVDAFDFEEFVRFTYGHEYCFQADEEQGNDTTFDMGALTKEPLDTYDAGNLAEFKQIGKYSYLSRVIMQDLCNRGLIEAGEYQISLSY